jgi:type IV pilus assembly protein PilN
LALNLEGLESVLLGGTTVLQATSNDDGLIQFSLEADLDPSVIVTPERLRELGSEGLARRYELLRERGVNL